MPIAKAGPLWRFAILLVACLGSLAAALPMSGLAAAQTLVEQTSDLPDRISPDDRQPTQSGAEDGSERLPGEATKGLWDAPIRVDLTPYLWGLGISTKGRISGKQIAASIPLHEIVDHLDNLFLGEVGIRKGPVMMFADITHAKITLPVKAGANAGDRLPIGSTFLVFAAGWSSTAMPIATIAHRPVTLRIEPFVGVGYNDLNVSIERSSDRVAALGVNWWMPLAGSRLDLARGRSTLHFEGSVAGFSRDRSG